MLQLIWACIESALDKLGLEAAATILATMIHNDGLTVAGLLADVFLLAVVIIAAEKGLEIARRDWRLRSFLVIEGTIGFGSLLLVWVLQGSHFDARVADVVAGASTYLVFPWIFIFVLSPLVLVWLALYEALAELGGSTIPRSAQVAVFVFFAGLIWSAGVLPPGSSDWSSSEAVLAALLLAIVPTMVILILIAYGRRHRLRNLSGLARAMWEFEATRSEREHQAMNSAQLEKIRRIYRGWSDNRDVIRRPQGILSDWREFNSRQALKTTEHEIAAGNKCNCSLCLARRAAKASVDTGTVPKLSRLRWLRRIGGGHLQFWRSRRLGRAIRRVSV
jgi:hypothetical protein